MISSNSLVGTHLFAATLRQMGRRFELVYGNLDWKLAESQLRRAARVTYAARYIQQAKIGVIGGHAPGFVDLHPHPFIVNKSFGTQVEMVGLVEFMDEVGRVALCLDCNSSALPWLPYTDYGCGQGCSRC